MEAYTKWRKVHKPEVIAHRKLRSVQLGEHINVQFESETTIPPVGALLDNVTVPVELLLPTTLDGATETDANRPARTANAPVTLDVGVLAVMTTPVSVDTAFVVTVNNASCEPAATVTVAGTVAAASLEIRLTTRPPVGALVSRLTIPVAVLPPATPAGEMVMTDTRGAVTDRSAFAEVPLEVAVIVAEVFAETAVVVIVNVADVAPAGIVTDAGILARVALLERSVTVVAVAAARLSVTVPVELSPPRTDVGLSVSVLNATAATAGFTVSVVVLLTPRDDAVITAGTLATTDVVVIANVAVLAPAATVTDAGTTAAAELLVTVTTTPPAGAGEPSVTVPVAAVPPLTLTGLTLTVDNEPRGSESVFTASVFPAMSVL